MPDLDIIDRAANPGWRGVTRMYAGGAASADEMRRPILKALAKSLRDGEGLPGLVDLSKVVQGVCNGDRSALAAIRDVRTVTREFGGHLHTRVAAEVVDTLIVEVRQNSTTIIEPATAVAERFLTRLVDYHLLGRARPYLVGQRFADHEAALQEENACKAALAPYVRKLAAGLVRDPTGKSVCALCATVTSPSHGRIAERANQLRGYSMRDNSTAAPATYNLILTDDGYVHTGVGKTKFPVAPSNRYYIDDQPIARAFTTGLDPVFADLADIALAIYVADRLCRRKQAGGHHYHPNWTRQINISLPLRDPVRWRDHVLAKGLSELLWFLTEDEWSFHFRARCTEGRPSENANFLSSMPPQPPVTTALFSGGLDSFVGLSEELEKRPQGSIVLFSAITNSRLGSRQRELVQDIRRLRGDNIIHVAVPLGLLQRDQMGGTDERTQRSRGFVLQVLGAVTALMAGAKTLNVYENGVGAISLPYTAAQLGAHNTRATNPLFLTMMGEFIGTVVGHQFAIRNPYLFRTKGQICEVLRRSRLRDLIRLTGSCDGFPLLRWTNEDQCGYCTSCLLRRQALHAAGLEAAESATRYLHDLTDLHPAAIDSRAHHKQKQRLWHWQAMDHQVALLQRAVAMPEPWPALSRAYSQLFEIAEVLESLGEPPLLVQSELVNLYSRYCKEWKHFSERVPVRLALRMN